MPRGKELEEANRALEDQTRMVVGEGGIMLMRLDGRAFHTHTKWMSRPFDLGFMAAIDAAAAALLTEVQGAFLAYAQSDEITVLASAMASPATQHWFGGSVQKVASVSASIATSVYQERLASSWHGNAGAGRPVFDCRVYPRLTVEEAAENLEWRMRDCQRNAVQAVAQHQLGKREIVGVPLRELMGRLADFDPEDAPPPGFMNGRLLRKERRPSPVEYIDTRDGSLQSTIAERSRVIVEAGPPREATSRAQLVKAIEGWA